MRIFNFRLSYACLAVILLGSGMDIGTTQILLARGYMELNPLFYFLGHIGFLMLFTVIAAFAITVLLYADSYLKEYNVKRRTARAILIALTLSYAAIHLFLGFGQLYVILGGH